MKSRINEDFYRFYRKLPTHVRDQVRAAYKIFLQDPNYPSLHFKRLQGTTMYSVRIGRSYRALGTVKGDVITWFWIGSHADYDKIISQ